MFIYKSASILCKPICQSFKNIYSFMCNHKELSLILFFTFMIRIFLAGWNSYWLDELYSVYERGIKFESIFEALKYHQNSFMPLYELILYVWMKIFGHTEVATRVLSTIYVTLSSLFLYLFALKTFGRRIAITSILLFDFSYMSLYYSLEARYYGQVLFLCVLSSYLLFVYLESVVNNFSWHRLFINKYLVLLAIVNVALMLTFPFNYFFLAAQAIYMILYLVCLNRQENIFFNILKVVALYTAQILVMIVLWGPQIIRSFIQSVIFKDDSSGEVISGVFNNSRFSFFQDPLTILVNNVISPNIEISFIGYMLLLVLAISISIKYATHYKQIDLKNAFVTRKIYFVYVLLWTILPSVLVFLIFSLGQLDKLEPRYLIFCTPPLMLLLALALEEGIRLLDFMIKRYFNISLLCNYIRYAIIYAIIATIVLVAPGAYQAATARKHDWRGIANQIVQQIHRDSENNYIVIETTFRAQLHTLDYYFERFSDQVRVSANITRWSESELTEENNFFTAPIFTGVNLCEIEKHDYLIVAFTHHSINHFPKTLKLISEEYDLLASCLDDSGRGYLIYIIRPDLEYVKYKENRIAGVLEFNSVDDHVDLEFSPGFDANSSFTFELWVKLLDDIDSSITLFGTGESHDGAYGMHASSRGWLSFGVRTDEDLAIVNFANYRLNTWYHLAGVYDSLERKVYFYVDGVLIGTDILDGDAISLSEENFGFHLPATIYGSSDEIGYTNSLKYEARLWNVARTPEEIGYNMFSGLDGTEENLEGYWPLNEGAGFKANDLTENKNHGTISGAKWQKNAKGTDN